MGAIEIIASIIIVLSVIKLVVLALSPKSVYSFARKIYSHPNVMSVSALVLAAVVLYYLIDAGITIVDIFAVMLFIVLIMVVGIARYANEMMDWVMKKDLKNMLKEMWLYILIWVVLLVWGIVALFS